MATSEPNTPLAWVRTQINFGCCSQIPGRHYYIGIFEIFGNIRDVGPVGTDQINPSILEIVKLAEVVFAAHV